MRVSHTRRLELQFWAQAYAFEPSCEPPEDWPEQWRLGPAGFCPCYCGDHAPGFIGLYAIINGLALLLAETEPLKPAEERRLIDLGWKFLASRGLVAPWHGVRTINFERLAESLTYALSRNRRQWVRCERIETRQLDRALLIPTLERLIVASRVVIILLGRGHYTVLRGFTPTSWLLFDATGRVWMKRLTGNRFAFSDVRYVSPFVLTLSRSM